MASLIHLESISKVYNPGSNEVVALRPTDLHIEKGQMIAIIGPSGSGKSTLMHILGFLDTPTTGKILLDGQPIRRSQAGSMARIRNREIGFIFQSFNLLPKLSILQNVMLPLLYSGIRARERKVKAMEALDRVGLANRVSHRPSELSGGQCQRAAIARAIVTRPRIILADEPTGNLDSQTGESILQLFWDLHLTNHTIILVTHDPKVAQVATRRVFIEDGEIREDALQPGGLPETLSHRPTA